MHSRGLCFDANRDYDKAVADFDCVIEHDLNNSAAYNDRGVTWTNKKDFAKALLDFDKAIELNPMMNAAFINRGIVNFLQNNQEKTIRDFDEAIRLNANSSQAFLNRALARQSLGKLKDATKDFGEAIRLNPQNAYAFGNRATTNSQQKRFDEAVADFEKAMKLDPMDWLQRDYARFLATCPHSKYRDGAKALKLAKAAIEKAGKDAGWKYPAALAAALAETGDFDGAVREQKAALADKSMHADDRKEQEARLKLYEARKPFRYE